MNPITGLFERYYSTQYKYFMPRTQKEWKWVLDRFEMNFGDVFSSLPKDSLILDVGCGVGFLEHYLLDNNFTNIHAIDVSKEQIDVAIEKIKGCAPDYTSRVTFDIADAFDHLKAERQLDAIAIIDLLEHFPKDKVMELLALAFSALRDSGVLFLRVINADNPSFGHFFYHDFTHETPFTAGSLRQILAYVGFKPLRLDYERIPPIEGAGLIERIWNRFIHPLSLRFLGKLLKVPHRAFKEDLIAVAKK